MKLRIVLALMLLLSSFHIHAKLEGPALLDSLLREVPKPRNDTSKANLYVEICIYYQLADASKGEEWGIKALELARKVNWKKGIVKACNEIGNTYGFTGKYSQAIVILTQALKMAEEMADVKLISMTYCNLGIAFYNVADYPNALKCYFANLRRDEKRGNRMGQAISMTNIALVYQITGKYSTALGYYLKSNDIFEATGSRYYLGIGLSNIGSTYQALNNRPKALECFEKAIRLETELGNKYLIAQNYCNMGSVWSDLNNDIKALEYFRKALNIAKEIGDVQGAAVYMVNIASAYNSIATGTTPQSPERRAVFFMKNEDMLKEALAYNLQALSVAREIKARDLEKSALMGLSEIYKAQGNFAEALKSFKLSKAIQDSMFSLEKEKQIAGLEARRENEVKQKEIEVLTEKNSRQKVLIFSTLGGLLMLAVIVVIVAVLLRSKRRAHAILRQKDAVIQLDLDKAREYILSLLPAASASGDISSDWIFIPSSKLGGDAFGYHWLDKDHFAFYIMDVCGHGVGSALHAVSVMNILNSRSRIKMDLMQPAEVISGLNELFQYEGHGGLFFSMWYGVFCRSDTTLTYVNAGHPAPLMVSGQNSTLELGPANVAVGWMPGFHYQSCSVQVPPASKIILFSDGVYELDTAAGNTVLLKDFYGFLRNNLEINLADFHSRLKEHFRARGFPDDYSMVEIVFGMESINQI